MPYLPAWLAAVLQTVGVAPEAFPYTEAQLKDAGLSREGKVWFHYMLHCCTYQ